MRTLTVEEVAKAVHNHWYELMTKEGYHNPSNCPVRNQLFQDGTMLTKSKHRDRRLCNKCVPGLNQYLKLTPEHKEACTREAKAVVKALKTLKLLKEDVRIEKIS